MNWHYQSYMGNEFFAATTTIENIPRAPDLLFDFSIYPGLYINDDLELDESFESYNAMLDTTSKENYGYEFIQATPFTTSSTNASANSLGHLMFDENGIYLSDELLKALQACKPNSIIHRKLAIQAINQVAPLKVLVHELGWLLILIA